MKARRLERREVFGGRVLHLVVDRVALPNGAEAELEVVRHPGAAAVVPIAADGAVLLLRQYRYAAGGELWEVPAGTLEPGEPAAACAARELEEEAGVRAVEWLELGDVVPVPGYSTERIHLFAARGLALSRSHLERDEVVSEVRPVAADEVVRWLDDGTLVDAKTVVALCRARARGLIGSGA